MLTLQGKSAVVTGASNGIGLAIAHAFAEAGARVLIVGRRQSEVDRALVELGNSAQGLALDLSDPNASEPLARAAVDALGRPDVFVANAGIVRTGPVASVSPEDFDTQFALNTRGSFFAAQRLAPILRDGGVILFTSSIVTKKLLKEHAVYAGTKASVEAFARALAIELAPRRIRVNVLSPGPTNTGIFDQLSDGNAATLDADLAKVIPLGRTGQPSDLAAAALFLASDQACFITGANLPVDGGLSAS